MSSEEDTNESRDLCSCHAVHDDRVDRVRDRLVDVAGLSELFAALADEVRTKILYLLSFEELCTCDLAGDLGLTLPAVSHHLRLLKVLRLVKYRREGKMVYYSLADEHILKLIKVAQEHYAEER